MKTDPLHTLWNSAPNVPTTDAGEQLASAFLARRRKRRQFQAWWLAWTFVALTSVTALVVVHLIRNGVSGVAGQWALWPLLALPWCAAFIFLRRFRQEVSASSDAKNLPAALRGALASNVAERRRLSLIGALLIATVPILVLTIRQLHDAGKATVDQAWSMGMVFGAGLALGGTFVLWRYWHHLVPESRRIESLLRESDAA